MTETLMHINILEFKAILSGLKSLCDHICDSHIKNFLKILEVHCINNMGSCRSTDCDKITKSIWNWAIIRRLWLHSAHIPGRLKYGG